MRNLIGFSLILAAPGLLSGQTINLQDAVRSALENHPGIQIAEAQTAINYGQVQVAAGQFDGHTSTSIGQAPMVEQGMSLPAGASNYGYGLGWTQQYRSGITVNQQVAATRLGGTQPQIAFTLSVPLLRGRGRQAVDAQEIAAGISYRASLLDLSHAGAEAVLAVSITYWNTLAAERTLQVMEESETRAKKLVEDTRLLIQADRVPRIDLEQLQANLDDKTAMRMAAEQALLEQRQQLGLAMGLTGNDLRAAPLAADAFPEPAGLGILPISTQDYVHIALNRRADLEAARERQQAANAVAAGTKNGLLPQLTVNLTAGYAGGGSTVPYLPGLVSPGPNANATLTYEVSSHRQTALGLFAQANGRVRQETLRTEDLERTIVSGVVTAAGAVSRSGAELEKAREATRHHAVAAAGEKERFQNGLASLIDLVVTDERLTAGVLAQVAAQARYAIAVSQLRFATGTFFQAGDRKASILAADLVTLPEGEK